MTSSTPIDNVVVLLAEAGYRSLALPLTIAGLTFDFPAALVGQSPSPDLILVADLAFETEQRILRKVEGVARALDVTRSRRPLTTILVGPKPGAGTLDAMTKVCRVLPVGVVEANATTELLKNWLAVLLPLKLPELEPNSGESVGSLIQRSTDLDQRVVGLLDMAGQGASEVQSGLHRLLNDALDPPIEESAPAIDAAPDVARGVFE